VSSCRIPSLPLDRVVAVLPGPDEKRCPKNRRDLPRSRRIASLQDERLQADAFLSFLAAPLDGSHKQGEREGLGSVFRTASLLFSVPLDLFLALTEQGSSGYLFVHAEGIAVPTLPSAANPACHGVRGYLFSFRGFGGRIFAVDSLSIVCRTTSKFCIIVFARD
jgi:hypothetical protein